MRELPIHGNLKPCSLRFDAAPDEIFHWFAARLPLARLERAVSPVELPGGYYRGETDNGGWIFIRMLPSDRKSLQERTDRLSAFVADQGVPVPRPLPGWPQPVLGYWAFAYPWLSGHIVGQATLGQMTTLGRQLAQLHRALADFPSTDDVRAASDREWANRRAWIRALARRESVNGEYRHLAQTLLQEWDCLRNSLSNGAQIVHNDLHRGNLLFNDATAKFQFIDFEEATRSWFAPAMDLSWVVERFCLLEENQEADLAHAFLKSYNDAAGGRSRVDANQLIDLIRFRCVSAMALLSQQFADDATLFELQEWQKFAYLIERLPDWQTMLTPITC